MANQNSLQYLQITAVFRYAYVVRTVKCCTCTPQISFTFSYTVCNMPMPNETLPPPTSRPPRGDGGTARGLHRRRLSPDARRPPVLRTVHTKHRSQSRTRHGRHAHASYSIHHSQNIKIRERWPGTFSCPRQQDRATWCSRDRKNRHRESIMGMYERNGRDSLGLVLRQRKVHWLLVCFGSSDPIRAQMVVATGACCQRLHQASC